MARRNSDSGRYAVIWLATAYIAVIGAGASAFVILVASDQPQGPLIVLGSSLGLLAVVLLILNIQWDQPISHLKLWLTAQNRSDPTDDYRAARRRIEAREKQGENRPPTIESVRDAAEHGGAWVPHSTGNDRRPKRS